MVPPAIYGVILSCVPVTLALFLMYWIIFDVRLFVDTPPDYNSSQLLNEEMFVCQFSCGRILHFIIFFDFLPPFQSDFFNHCTPLLIWEICKSSDLSFRSFVLSFFFFFALVELNLFSLVAWDFVFLLLVDSLSMSVYIYSFRVIPRSQRKACIFVWYFVLSSGFSAKYEYSSFDSDVFGFIGAFSPRHRFSVNSMN